MKVERLFGGPIIEPNMDSSMGSNINGPSLIQAPEWVDNPLGKYYLYFAHHQGKYIRLAYADRLAGPWRTYETGTLQLGQSFFSGHIASPDVHVDEENQQIVMYYHGCCMPAKPRQVTRVATSADGINFTARSEVLGGPYWRVFEWQGYYYGVEMWGQFYRSKNWLTGFEKGPKPKVFTEHMRHLAVKIVGNTLYLFYSNAYDCPERILVTKIDLRDDWLNWEGTQPETVLQPEMDYEGGELPLEPSRRGVVLERAKQLRDPGIFTEGDQDYLLYSVAGEHGIAIAKISEFD